MQPKHFPQLLFDTFCWWLVVKIVKRIKNTSTYQCFTWIINFILNNLYSPPYIIMIIKSGITWPKYVAHLMEEKNAERVLV
jgi:hypothetical protein